MDIQVASNFERYLYYKFDGDSEQVTELLQTFAETGSVEIPGFKEALFTAGVGQTSETMAVIKRYFESHGYTLDPHTAVGVCVGEQHLSDSEPMICVSTAHPAKFTAAITEAIGEEPHHQTLDALADAETRCHTIANDEAAIRAYLDQHV